MSGLSQITTENKGEIINYSIGNGDFVRVETATGKVSFHSASGSEGINEASKKRIMMELSRLADDVHVYMGRNFKKGPGFSYSEEGYAVMKSQRTGIGRKLRKFNLHKGEIPLDAPGDPTPEIRTFLTSRCYV